MEENKLYKLRLDNFEFLVIARSIKEVDEIIINYFDVKSIQELSETEKYWIEYEVFPFKKGLVSYNRI